MTYAELFAGAGGMSLGRSPCAEWIARRLYDAIYQQEEA